MSTVVLMQAPLSATRTLTISVTGIDSLRDLTRDDIEGIREYLDRMAVAYAVLTARASSEPPVSGAPGGTER